MKKYLLLILTMLSVSIGTWADTTVTITNSPDQDEPTSTTIAIVRDGESEGTITVNGSLKGKAGTTTTITGPFTATVWTAINDGNHGGWNTQFATKLDLSGVTGISTPAEIGATGILTRNNNGLANVEVVILPTNCAVPTANETKKSDLAPEYTFDIWDNLKYFIIPQSDGSCKVVLVDAINAITTSDLTCSANGTVEVLAIFDDEEDAPTEENVSEVITQLKNAGYKTPAISISGCNVTINMADATESFATLLSNAKASVIAAGESGICTLTVTGELSDTDLGALNSSSTSGTTRIDLSGATIASGSSIENIDVPLTLTSLVLPPNSTITDAMALEFSAYSGLNYVYSPTNDSGASVADYVWVNKAGGLAQAFENESTLRSGIYIKVASNVALNATDMAFNSLTNKNTVYQYLDLSGANISSSTVFTNSSAASPYRIILPNNWTGDNMAEFSSRATLGSAVAALYSYNGTKLNVLGLANTYSTSALRDNRIVRDGTTAVEFLEGKDQNNDVKGMFTKNMLLAINDAKSSITSVKISANNIIPTWTYNQGGDNNELTFDNDNITSLDMSYVNKPTGENYNLAMKLDVSGCSKLEILNLAGDEITSVDAHGCTNLKAISLIGTTISGDFNVSNSGITRITVDTRIGGTITATGCSSLNRITNSGTIGGDIIANGTSGAKLSNLTTFINNGTISGDVNLSYTGLTTFTNNGSVKNINLSHCDATGFTTFAPAGTINGDIDLTDCTNLTSINVANATINYRGTYNTGYSADVNFTRSSQSDINNSVYDSLKDGSNGYNVTKATSGQDNLTIIPAVEVKTAAAASTSVAGVTEDDCALTVGITGDETLTSLLQKFYAMKNKIADYTTVTTGSGGNLSELSICNLTVTGEINATDIATINALTFGNSLGAGIVWRDATLNLDGATLASGVSLATNNITNTTVNNIILPRNLDKDVVNATNFSSCTNLNAAVSLNAARTQVVGYVKKPGMLRQTLSQVPDFQRNPWQYMQGLNLPSVTLTGELLACDIATGNDHVIANGNYKQNPTSEEKLTGYDCCLDNHVGLAFEGVNTLRNLDIKDAIFVDAANTSNINEENMTLSELGWAGIVSLEMPYNERMVNLPARFLRNCKQISYVCIPYYYKTIGDEAFYLAGTNWITTTDSKGAVIDNGINTYTISKNVRQIGSDPGTDANGYPNVPTYPVFGAVNSGQISDIYILRNGYEDYDSEGFTPTKCWRGGFTSGMTYGWGGFDGGNIYCREKYKNGAFLFTILHYPDQASLPSAHNKDTEYEAMEKAYTDITKQYTKKDQTGALDANGDPIPWPTFAELGRSYNQAIRGLIWADWDPVYGENPDGNIKGGTINFDPTTHPDGVEDAASQTRFNADYVGWHEFVLSKATYVAPDEIVKKNVVYREYQSAQYYTFCVPFDMTPAEVLSLMGVPASTETVKTIVGSFTFDEEGNCINIASANSEDLYPKIYTLKSVARTLATETDPNKIQLILSKDLSAIDGGVYRYWMPNGTAGSYVSNEVTRAEDEVSVSGSDVMIRGGYPYLIKAYLPVGAKAQNGSLGKYVLSRYAFPLSASSAVVRRAGTYIGLQGNTYVSYFARPYDQHLVQATLTDPSTTTTTAATRSDGNGGTVPYNYRFMGEYWQQWMPTHTYYLYPREHKWYYNKEVTDWKWAPYVCIINANDESYVDPDDGSYTGDVTDVTEEQYYRGAYGSEIPYSDVNDSEGHAVFKKNLKLHYNTSPIDDTDFSNASARQFSFVFDDDIIEVGDDNITAIDHINGAEIRTTTGKVYNMAGQYVGNSVDGLTKGMYIVNGKKIVIK